MNNTITLWPDDPHEVLDIDLKMVCAVSRTTEGVRLYISGRESCIELRVSPDAAKAIHEQWREAHK